VNDGRKERSEKEADGRSLSRGSMREKEEAVKENLTTITDHEQEEEEKVFRREIKGNRM
jgi:hypothetical protein